MWQVLLNWGKFEMEQAELINSIVREVHDPKLRESLLRSVLDAGVQSKESLLINELAQLGLNVPAVQKVVRYQFRVGLVLGVLISGLFVVIGGLIVLIGLVHGQYFNVVVPLVFCVLGAINLRKLVLMRAVVCKDSVQVNAHWRKLS